jgi:hypothetical protein
MPTPGTAEEELMARIWDYDDQFDVETDMVGYKVEASDGSIGKIDEATYEAGGSYVVVDTGPWIFGKKVLLPAGVITSVDHEDESVWVARSKDEIKAAPESDEARDRDDAYRETFGTYYGGFQDDADIR